MSSLEIVESQRAVVERELEKIRQDNDGRLTGDLVYETARDVEHPLHALVFDCAPEEAGERYYRLRARAVVRMVTIRRRIDDEVLTLRRYRMITRESGSRSYEDIDQIKQDPVAQELLRRDMLRDLRGLKQRYADLERFFHDAVAEVFGTAT